MEVAIADIWNPSMAQPSTSQTPESQTPDPRSSSARRTHAQVEAHTYGYHQTFHTHAQPLLDSPPSYDIAVARPLRCAPSPSTINTNTNITSLATTPELPPYNCTVERRAILGLSREATSPFSIANDQRWYDVFVILQGTLLSVHRVKSPHLFSKRKQPEPGKLIRSYTLQHAEVGIATDFKKTDLTPRHPLAHLVPPASRPKLYETDPHLFDPVREHVLRVRLETEQLLLCASSQEQLLDWVEGICAAIDIAPPLEDRCDPRYRSLPRRSRRQRILDTRLMTDLDNLSSDDGGRRLVADQERILRALYPQLANQDTTASAVAVDATTTTTTNHNNNNHNDGDPEEADLDRSDVAFPGQRPVSTASASSQRGAPSDDEVVARPDSACDGKMAPRPAPSYAQHLRYRRRCAPILLYTSNRTSEVVFHKGKRMRINVYEHMLKAFEPLPPRYDAHGFPKPANRNFMQPVAVSHLMLPTEGAAASRPAQPLRTQTDETLPWSMGGDEISPVTTNVIHEGLVLSSDGTDNNSIESAHELPTSMTRTKSNESGTAQTEAAEQLTNALGVKMSNPTGPKIAMERTMADLSLLS